MQTLETLVSRFPHHGLVSWIGVRPARKEAMLALNSAEIRRIGISGDHRARAGKRTITLIQAEHLSAIASLAQTGDGTVEPERLRRNIVVSGISLIALRNRSFQIGTAILRGTGLCAPCSRMESELGHGGYNAMRGHGGICAEVLQEGTITIGSHVRALEPSEQDNLPVHGEQEEEI